MKTFIWAVFAALLTTTTPVVQAAPAATPTCQNGTATVSAGSTADATAKAFCQSKGNDWYTYTATTATSLDVTCCDVLPTSGTTVPADVVRLIDAAQADAALNDQLRAAKTDTQLEAIAKSHGYNVSAQDIAAAMQSNVYEKNSTVSTRSTRTLAASACGGLLQLPCSVCTKSITVYFPFNFCCIPIKTSCTEYQSQCHSGYYGNREGVCWPSSWTSTKIGQWAINFDKRWKLPMDWIKLNWVTELKSGMRQTPADGLYIFVYRTSDNKLLIRRSDRPDDKGIYADGNKTYSYPGNPAGNGESPHMFVRHTQLNGGWTNVWSAGQLEVYHGKIIWVSNASGHYAPPLPSLNYVTDTLQAWGLATPGSVKHFPHEWHKSWVNIPNSGLVIDVAIMQNGTILGVGTDKNLYTRATLGSNWVQAHINGQVTSVAIMQDGTILGVGTDKNLYTRATLGSNWVQAHINGQVTSVAIMQDGTILGVGTDKNLYTRTTLGSNWVQAHINGQVTNVAIMQDGTILGVGTDKNLYMRATLSSNWVAAPKDGQVTAITVMKDNTILGIGTGQTLWIRQKLQ